MKITKWDLAESIETKEDVIAHLSVALEENDTEFLFEVLGSLARSKGIASIAKELNLNREALYRSLSHEGNPLFSTVLNVLNNLGLTLIVKPTKSTQAT
jgi:probable addiction module antidote protein